MINKGERKRGANRKYAKKGKEGEEENFLVQKS